MQGKKWSSVFQNFIWPHFFFFKCFSYQTIRKDESNNLNESKHHMPRSWMPDSDLSFYRHLAFVEFQTASVIRHTNRCYNVEQMVFQASNFGFSVVCFDCCSANLMKILFKLKMYFCFFFSANYGMQLSILYESVYAEWHSYGGVCLLCIWSDEMNNFANRLGGCWMGVCVVWRVHLFPLCIQF